MTSNSDIKEFEQLLERFQQLPKTEPNPETILEISDFPHSEIAISNILAFFLDPNEQHGFNGLVLESLLESAGGAELSAGDFRSVKVSREDRTDSNKSIDLVIVSDSFVVGIENKIYASVYNPFAEYNKRLERIADGRHITRILLTLRPESDHVGFKSVTYDNFFSVLQQHLGRAISHANTRWLVFLIDFMNTIQNLKEGHVTPELLQFFQKNEESLHDLYLAIPQLTGHLESKAKPVWDSIKAFRLPNGFTKWRRGDQSAYPDRKHFAYSIWVEADLGGSYKLGLEAVIRLSGWQIIVWPNSHEDIAIKRAKTFINNSGMDFKRDAEFPYTWEYKHLSYEDNPETVAEIFSTFVANVSKNLPKT